MDLLKRLFGGKSAGSQDSSARYYYVKGKKCGAITRLRLDMRNDLSRDDDDNFYVRKVAVDNKCYGQVEIELTFDANHKELSRNITGGEFVTQEDWAAWERAQTTAS
jgi:hypothetical protein